MSERDVILTIDDASFLMVQSLVSRFLSLAVFLGHYPNSKFKSLPDLSFPEVWWIRTEVSLLLHYSAFLLSSYGSYYSMLLSSPENGS
jgi:hypothetical protein